MSLSKSDGRRTSTSSSKPDHVVRRHRTLAAVRWLVVVTVLGIAGAIAWTAMQPAAFEASSGRDIAGGPAAYADEPGDRPVEPALGIPSERPRIVELYQDHCPACERTKAQVDRLRRDCAGRQVEILAINADDSRNTGLLEHLGVDMVPTFILLTDEGREAGRLVGAPELAQLRQAAASLLNQTCAGESASGDEGGDETVGAGCSDSPPAGTWDEHDPHPLLENTDETCQG